MRHTIGLAWVAVFLIASAAPLQAQTTIQRAADILNDREPTRVEPPLVETGRRTTIIVPQREILVIERVQARHGWWKHPRYRVITVYYDGSRFYRRPFDRRTLRKVVVYERAGRYYIDEGQWRRDHRRHYGRDYDGWKDDDKRRHDDKWKNDDRWKDEDKRKDDDDKRESKGNNGRHLGHDKDKDD
ncbi:MAG TPA: hypothetical protein VHH32_05865 [Gemmatimonadales bacterium]|nr:hypothetical protein [Gemmatimonadales bacterium]